MKKNEIQEHAEIIQNKVSSVNNGCLIKFKNKYYVVSSINNFFGEETLVFPANENGKIIDFLEVAGGRKMTREEAIKNVEETL